MDKIDHTGEAQKEVICIGTEIFEGALEIAGCLNQFVVDGCETIKVEKHPYLEGKALISNGGDVATVDIGEVQLPSDHHWSVSVYEASNHLKQAVESKKKPGEIAYNFPLLVTVQIQTSEGPVRIKVWEKEKANNVVSDISEENLYTPNSVKPAGRDNVNEANNMVKSVIRLLKEKQIEPIK